MLTKKNLSLRAGCAVIALVLVAGCGTNDSDEPSVKKSTSTPSAPASTPPAPRPTDTRRDASSLAFAEFVAQRIIAVTTGADLDEFLSMATPECKGCINLAKQVQKDGTVKQEYETPPVVSGAKIIDQDKSTGQVLVQLVVDLAPGREVDTATGATVKTFDEASRLSMRVLMTWKDDRWRLTNYSAENA